MPAPPAYARAVPAAWTALDIGASVEAAWGGSR